MISPGSIVSAVPPFPAPTSIHSRGLSRSTPPLIAPTDVAAMIAEEKSEADAVNKVPSVMSAPTVPGTVSCCTLFVIVIVPIVPERSAS